MQAAAPSRPIDRGLPGAALLAHITTSKFAYHVPFGVLQADAFAGYADLYLGGQIREAACMAHARRKLHDLHAVRASPITSEALERIAHSIASKSTFVARRLKNVGAFARRRPCRYLMI